MKNFKNLKVWQKGIELVKLIYIKTSNFPKEEIFGLTSQIRRSAVSIPSNISEGAGRGTKKELNNFLNLALGSTYELETQLIISREIGFISNEDFDSLYSILDEIQKMIFGLQKSLK
jgi:four helix bundle protein